MTTAFFASIETTTAEETMQKENKIRNGNLSKTYSGKTSINEKAAEKDTVNSNYNENTERNKNVEKDIANTLKKGNKEARETKKITILGDKIIDWELSKHLFCPATDCTKDYIKPSLKQVKHVRELDKSIKYHH